MRTYTAHEYKLVALRDFPAVAPCDTPESAVDYWRNHVMSHPFYNKDVECLVVLMLNTRRRIIGHHLVSNGSLDTVLVHAREVFRAAIVAASSAIVIAHNHPSGDPTPSAADINVTRDLHRAGQLLNISVLDHVIIGHTAVNPKGYASLKELGYFYN